MNVLAKPFSSILLGIVLGCGLSCVWAGDDAQAWLEKMNEALATRNYVGTFSHMRHGKVETVENLRIIHRVDNNSVTERLIFLDGSGSEVIRNEDQLACFIPSQRRVLVDQRPPKGPLVGRLPAFDATIGNYYLLQTQKPARVSGRKVQVVTVTPKDAYRYGYCLWLDEKTAMPLRTQLLGARGAVIEEVLFSDLTLYNKISKQDVQPQVNSEGFQWVRQQVPAEPMQVQAPAWRASRVPPGFKLKIASSQTIEGSKTQLSHLVYSDGLASVSVFIEQSPQREVPQGSARVGSAFTFSTFVQGHQVTAVGEVPVETVKLIAGSTRPGAAAAPALAAERP